MFLGVDAERADRKNGVKIGENWKVIQLAMIRILAVWDNMYINFDFKLT